MINIIIEKSEYEKQIIYSINHLMRGIKVEYKILYLEDSIANLEYAIIYLSNENISSVIDKVQNGIIIRKTNNIFGEFYLRKESLPKYVNDKNGIIEFYENYLIEIDNNMNIIDVDIITNTFFMLSRYEEIVLTKNNNEILDNHQRFSSDNCVLCKEGLLERPIVDEYWYYLKEQLRKFGYKFNENNEELVVCLTHDIDSVQKYYSINNAIRSSASWLLKQRKFKKSYLELKEYFEGKLNYKKDAFWTFEKIVELEKSRGFTASYYFMTSGKAKVDNLYNIDEERIRKVIDYLDRNSMEVGFHGGYDSFDNENEFSDQIKELRKVVKNNRFGVRQHFLRFKVPITWRIQSKKGILYDTTLGYADSIGFRAGTSIPFKPYDLEENKILELWEIPLIVMDTSLKNAQYCNLSPQEGYEKIIELMETVRKYNGIFTLLFHNSSFDVSWYEWKELYERIINYIDGNRGVAFSGRDIVDKYLDRDSTRGL